MSKSAWEFRVFGVVLALLVFQGAVSSVSAQLPQHDQAIQYRLDRLIFNGIMTIGDKTSLGFFDPSTDSSLWIPLNGSSSGLKVSDYNKEKDTIVVSYLGKTKEITLRNPLIVPISVKSPPKPEKYVVPKSDKILMEEERARMMVSDILEIGMKERARRKAEKAAARRKAEAEKRARIGAQKR